MTTVTRAEMVADTLQQAIRDGAYPCGERLIELHLAAELNVSQNTIREALRLLEQDGWVTRHARRGVYVRTFTPDEAEEIYALWAAVEGLAFRWVSARLNRVELLAALRPSLEWARECHHMGRWSAAREALFSFHETIAALPNRPQTQTTLKQLYNQARLLDVDYEFHVPRDDDTRAAHLAAYEHLFGVIKFDELDSAGEALQRHIIDLGKPIVRWLAMNS